MFSQFKEHIYKNYSFLQDKRLLIANSGGIDSMVLTALLNKLEFSISLAHCNFSLRGKESDLDAKFVQRTGEYLNTSVFVKQFDTQLYAAENSISIQMAARDLRYKWFDSLLENKDFDYLLTAHHADDNIETFLINFIRGSGLDGLTGIPPINGKIIRPLLPFTRNNIVNFAEENKVLWREDKSNFEKIYMRNKLRHDVIPILKEMNSSFTTSFNKTIENLQGSGQIIADRLDEVKEEIVESDMDIKRFNIKNIKSLSDPKIYLFELLKGYGFSEWDDILNLLDAQSGKQVFSKTYRLLKDREFLILSKINSKNESLEFQIKEKTVECRMENFVLKFEPISFYTYKRHVKNEIGLDKSLLNFPLIVRKWKKGDYFYPVGMQGRKKLSKYFKDEKLSILEKEKIWLLCTSKNEIVWIINKRMDDRFKITSKTTKFLKIEA